MFAINNDYLIPNQRVCVLVCLRVRQCFCLRFNEINQFRTGDKFMVWVARMKQIQIM